MRIFSKIIVLLLFAAVLVSGFYYAQWKPNPNPQFGLSFSIPHAQYLGFDWKTLYLDMLNDLKPNKLRLMAYWEMIEPEPGRFDFHQIDEMLIEAGKRRIDVVLVLGHKQPRWPECHHPAWYESLGNLEKETAQVGMLKEAVGHFRQFESIKAWQIENEPFFEFGYNCPKMPSELVKNEIAAVKHLDARPVLLTDSGEQGDWVATASLGADWFGSTMYRTVYNSKLGYYKYPIPSAFFRMKAGWLTAKTDVEKIIGIELQAEPWFIADINDTPLEAQFALMNPKVFRANIEYAKQVGFEENYLWGVEWWYWLAKKHNDWGMWEEVKKILSSR